MKLIVIVNPDADRKERGKDPWFAPALKIFLEPENEVLECDSLQEVGKRAKGREICALFLAWPPAGPEGIKIVQKFDWSTDYVVPVLLLRRGFSTEELEAEAQQAGDWSKKTTDPSLWTDLEQALQFRGQQP